jgi:hypothetical protein
MKATLELVVVFVWCVLRAMSLPVPIIPEKNDVKTTKAKTKNQMGLRH